MKNPINQIKKRALEPLEKVKKLDVQDVAGEVQGLGLNILTKFAASELPDQLGMRKTMENFLYESSKTGFEFVSTQLSGSKSGSGEPKQLTEEQIERKKRGIFDLNLTEEQQAVRESLRSFAKEMIQPAAHDADHDHKTPDELMDMLGQMGVMYYAVPEEFEGMAGKDSTVTQMLSLEDLGYGDFSIGAAGFCSVSAANVIRRYGTKEQKKTFLPMFMQEVPLKATLATVESNPGSTKLQTKIKKNGPLYVLSGEKHLVMQAKDAELFVVSALLDGKPELFLVDASSEGISISDDPAMGLKPAATCKVKFSGVRLLESNRLRVNYQEFLDLSRLSVCALACGVGDAVLEYVIPYVNEREAFGEPISHRQSVAFMVSNIAIELEAMRVMTWRAVSRAQMGMEFHREAHLAYLLCCEKAMQIGLDAVQLLGGHGYTKEHPVERYYRDLRSLPVLSGALCL